MSILTLMTNQIFPLSYYYGYPETTPTEVIYFLVLAVLMIIILRYILLWQRLRNIEKDLQAHQAYISQLEPGLERYRHFRHDCKNLLTSINLSMDPTDFPEIYSLSNTLFYKSNQPLMQQPMLNLYKIDVQSVRRLMLLKWYEATNKNVQLEFELFNRYEHSQHNASPQTYLLIQSLLDQAIEFSQTNVPSKIFVAFVTNADNQQIIISCITDGQESSLGKYHSQNLDNHLSQTSYLNLLTEQRENRLYQTLTIGKA